MKRTGDEAGIPWDFLWDTKKVLCGVLALGLLYGAALRAGAAFLSPAFFVLFLAGAGLEDGLTGYISDAWSLLLGAFGLLTALLSGNLFLSLLSALLAASIYGFLYFISRQSLGTGDIFLAAAAASWLTPLSCLLFIWLSSLSALFFVGIRMLTGRQHRGEPVWFGPFMALGGVLAYGWQEIWPFLPPGFPFA